MRTILIFLSLVIIAIISIPLYGVVWILGKIAQVFAENS